MISYLPNDACGYMHPMNYYKARVHSALRVARNCLHFCNSIALKSSITHGKCVSTYTYFLCRMAMQYNQCFSRLTENSRFIPTYFCLVSNFIVYSSLSFSYYNIIMYPSHYSLLTHRSLELSTMCERERESEWVSERASERVRANERESERERAVATVTQCLVPICMHVYVCVSLFCVLFVHFCWVVMCNNY